MPSPFLKFSTSGGGGVITNHLDEAAGCCPQGSSHAHASSIGPCPLCGYGFRSANFFTEEMDANTQSFGVYAVGPS
ncbi:hypothetical protein Plhal304r1_c040g0118501 [Plasmopara halstedii]